MSMIQKLFQQTQLAEVAYTNFIDTNGNLITDTDFIKTALKNEGMSDTQAMIFLDEINGWRVVAQMTR